ncbi:MAG: 1-deoxy-D-xylulose-5-phosphate reductoisomerase [Candidatus Rokubacteria bacterium 13_1_20CM_2_68_19]|nr:MAG: 1-deoxy-D-xylulose-5-phosphate reductoisomerase [Candidatus Rokubacteria bacterium 13_2_20CM_2_64_8]OLC62623.1 MAG: 1-deoxy-D-xylulose-5-phosphate reductoisomerase [Candidatus Rokubacteria bacterium 13_1_40CM_4_67_11]OLE42998.1 MAG: 1-deoxy-D-xylulose-5-phosphate reductoisomerase [Candidatus Rokubacteria bacterium 13_1_20CM_2_68_19]PYM93772.1 MAG: 1-deoxy-D-xylulose-5-phosphate reductoisomerase [Candidatus Rokubacteria bacterium]PYN65221.1 MAG: 1-deoxy-D-xylulose-5-phosphate reductoisom
MKRITVLGATGSIGLRTLEIVSSFPEEFSVAGVAARGTTVERLVDIARKYAPQAIALLEPEAVDRLAALLPRPRPELLAGADGLVALTRDVPADVVVSALVGGAGLLPTMAAIRAGRAVALANKETLVMAGRLMTTAARHHGVPLLPVDSEHSAVFQCLCGHNRRDVHRILLTASGGPFRELPKEQFATITVDDALRHPTWKMGAKITIDSATLMNKGLEVIEARWLFDVAPEQVQIVVHPQSVVHSMVEYIDGSVIAQLGVADMGVPILYALTYPERRPTPAARLDLARVGQLTFFEPDPARFPCLRLARHALEQGGAAPVVLNAANEIAVAAFLDRRIAFTDIPELIEDALVDVPAGELESIEACVAIDAETRRRVERAVAARAGRKSL